MIENWLSTSGRSINDEVLEGIHAISTGIESCDAESDLPSKSIPPEIEEVEFDPEGDILFLESLLYDNSSPRPPEALQANSNDIESLPPSHIPVADNDHLWRRLTCFLAVDAQYHPGIERTSTIDVVEDIPKDVP
ncbi:hypothetical protein Tco_0366744 [Tanacetum coccineum]